MYTLLYFSPTGNVLHLTQALAEHLGPDDVEIVPLESARADQLAAAEHLVLLYPMHGFNPPRNVKHFVERMPSGLFGTVSLIGVGCTDHWVNEAASSSLRRRFTARGYSIGLDQILAMPLTFVMAFPDDVARALVAESEKRIEALAESLDSAEYEEPSPSAKSRLVSFLGGIESPASRLFGLELHANKDCISCGTCWSHCPQGNIKRGPDGRPRFGLNCLMCMRCVYGCPQKAISPRISKFLRIKNGYSLSRYLDE